MNAFDLITRVVFLCSKHRGSVSSWGRTPKHNEYIGGVPNSYHQIWMGCDVVLDEAHVSKVVEEPKGSVPRTVVVIVQPKNQAFEDDAKLVDLLAILEGDHYHLQPMSLAA